MTDLKRLCVFCGSKSGHGSKYLELAHQLGKLMAERNIGLVYGAASIGVMGALADSVLENGGQVWGVIPEFLAKREISHSGLTHLEITNDMHQRKQKMYELSDGFLALPGGIGTLDELCEILTWGQIDLHSHPCYILNHEGFYDNFINHLKMITQEDFFSKEDLDDIRIETTITGVINRFLQAIFSPT